MNLEKKLIVFINACVVLACVIVGVISYFIADAGFTKVLEFKADSDLKQIADAVDKEYPGAWVKKSDGLYKGNLKLTGNFDLVDHFGSLTGNAVTVLDGGTRVATTIKGSDGKRVVGSQADAHIQEAVLQRGEMYTGNVNVGGRDYMAVYKPLKDAGGSNIGMLYLGLPMEELTSLQSRFIYTMVGVVSVLVLIFAVLISVVAKKGVAPLKAVEKICR